MQPNLIATANIVLERLNEDGEVVYSEELHNLVVNTGLSWIMKRIFGVFPSVGAPSPAPATTNLNVVFGRGRGSAGSEANYIPTADQTALADSNPTTYDVGDADITFTAPASVVIAKTIQSGAPRHHIREIGVRFGTTMIAIGSRPLDYDNSSGDPLNFRIQYQLINAV